MATLLGTCLQKLYSYSLNLNSLFMSTRTRRSFLVWDNNEHDDDGDETAVRGEDHLNAQALERTVATTTNQQQHPDPHESGSEPSEVRKRGFYRSNLVLDTNHCHHPNPTYSCRDQSQVITRARAQRNGYNQLTPDQNNHNGKVVLASRRPRQQQKSRAPQNQTPGVSGIDRLDTNSKTKQSPSSSCTCPAARVAESLKMGAIKFLGCSTNGGGSGKRGKNRLPTTNGNSNSNSSYGGDSDDGKDGYKSWCCNCGSGSARASGSYNNNNNNNECHPGCASYTANASANAGDPPLKKKVYCFHEAPHYLRFNPHITDGYRGMLRPVECIKSLFWWTNETMNIWTHLFGWFFFLALSVYDFLGLIELPNIQPLDKLMLTGLLLCFQACMLLSSLYHIFCCHSEVSYRRWLSLDLLGVSLSLLAIYVSGIYYAFSCVPFWLNFYLVTVGAIFATAMFMQILPIISKAEMVTEERFRWRLVVFGGWAAYGVVPTMHWAYLHGMAGPAVSLLLPRIFGVYVLSAAAFFFYVTRIPEKLWPGLVNYIGSSHQIWHILIVAALYHWHNTGMLYLQFRAAHPCAEEYEYLFGVKYSDVIE